MFVLSFVLSLFSVLFLLQLFVILGWCAFLILLLTLFFFAAAFSNSGFDGSGMMLWYCPSVFGV